MELFTPVVDQSKFHPTFAGILQNRNPSNEAVIADWATGFVDRDNKFVREFQTTFDGSFWELYLHAVLKHLGCAIDFSHSSPDFVLTSPSLCIEATVALHADGTPSAATRDGAPIPDDLNELNRQAIIRLSNSFVSKTRKYESSYRHLPHVSGRPFLIAIAPFDRSHFQLQAQRAIEAVLFDYYVNDEAHLRSADPSLRLTGHSIKRVVKDSGASVALGVFNDATYAEISAILFSTAGCWGKVRALANDKDACTFFNTVHYNPNSVRPITARTRKWDYTETILDGLRVYHNPFATYPLDRTLFRSPEVFQTYYNRETEEWDYEFNTRNLLFRHVETLILKKGR